MAATGVKAGLVLVLDNKAKGWLFLEITGKPESAFGVLCLIGIGLKRVVPMLAISAAFILPGVELLLRFGSFGGLNVLSVAMVGENPFCNGDSEPFPVRADRGRENVVNFGTGTAASST